MRREHLLQLAAGALSACPPPQLARRLCQQAGWGCSSTHVDSLHRCLQVTSRRARAAAGAPRACTAGRRRRRRRPCRGGSKGGRLGCSCPARQAAAPLPSLLGEEAHDVLLARRGRRLAALLGPACSADEVWVSGRVRWAKPARRAGRPARPPHQTACTLLNAPEPADGLAAGLAGGFCCCCCCCCCCWGAAAGLGGGEASSSSVTSTVSAGGWGGGGVG